MFLHYSYHFSDYILPRSDQNAYPISEIPYPIFETWKKRLPWQNLILKEDDTRGMAANKWSFRYKTRCRPFSN